MRLKISALHSGTQDFWKTIQCFTQKSRTKHKPRSAAAGSDNESMWFIESNPVTQCQTMRCNTGGSLLCKGLQEDTKLTINSPVHEIEPQGLWSRTENIITTISTAAFPVRRKEDTSDVKSQMAEWLGNRALNQKVVGSIPGRAQWRCALGQGASPYLPRGGNVPVLTVSHSW